MSRTIRVFFGCLLVCMALGGAGCASRFLTDGDFENVARPLAGWTVGTDRAAVDVTRVGSDWVPITVRFNSGAYDQALLVIGAYSTPGGRCWIDNVRAEGFEVVNPSFEEEPSFLPLPPDAPKRNWRILPPPKPGGWFKDYDATHHVSDRASDGKRSVMFSDPAMATGMIRIWQAVHVKPHTDYSYTFDFFMGEDFSGSVSCPVLNVEFDLPGKYHLMGGAYSTAGVRGLNVSDLVADRAAAGYQQCRLTLQGGHAELARTVRVPADTHMEAGVSAKAKGLKGAITLAVADPGSGRVLAEQSITDTEGLWATLRLPFVSESSRVSMRVTATGEGTALVDGAYLSPPRLRPAAQCVDWGRASNDFTFPPMLDYQVDGDVTELLLTALEILRKDLAALGVGLENRPSTGAALSISTNDVPSSRGDEAYRLNVTPHGIRIEAAGERGAFYGVMTLLQLLARRSDGKAVAVACSIDDWPDLPWRALNRGAAGLTPEWMARRKANIAFHVSLDNLDEWRRHGIEPIPHDNITHYPSTHPRLSEILRDPNYAEGVERTDELVLKSEQPAELGGRNVVRTELTDIVVTSADGETVYEEGSDYRVIAGELKMSQRQRTSFLQDGKPFAIARIASGTIPDGAAVRATYEHVAPGCGELCLAELAPQEAVAAQVRQMVRDHDFPYIGLHVSESPRCVGKGPRCRATGLTPSQLIGRYYARLDRAIKQAKPNCRLITHADDFLPWQHTARSGMADAPALLPRDSILSCWHYAASDSVAFAYKTAMLCKEHDLAFFLVPMYDYWNIHVYAAAALWAREQGLKSLGLSDWAYHLGPYAKLKAPAPFIERALCVAWRVS